MQALADRVAIITGASRGIGAATAMRLASDGAKVVVNYHHNVEAAHHVVEIIRKAGGVAEAIQADISNFLDVRRLIDQTVATFGRLDILVNNAGVAEFVPLEKIDDAHFHRLFNLNVLGLVCATQAAVMAMTGTQKRLA